MIYNLTSRNLVKNLRRLDYSSGLTYCTKVGESTIFNFEFGPIKFPVIAITDSEAGVNQLQVESIYLNLVEQIAGCKHSELSESPYVLSGENMTETLAHLKQIQAFREHDDCIHAYLGLEVGQYGFYRFSGSVAYLYHRTEMGYTSWRL